MTSEDFTTFIDFGRWIQWGIEGTPENISRTSTVVTFYGCNNGSTFLYKDYGADYYQDFIHFLDVTQNTGENGAIVFPWMLSNDIGDAKTLRDSSKDLIAIKFETVSGTHIMSLEECNAGTIYDSTSFTHGLTKRYLTITKSGIDFQVEVFNSSDDRAANTNVQAILNLTLHSDYSFRYIYAGSSWFTNKNENKMIKMEIENLVIGVLPPDLITKYDGIIPSGLNVSPFDYSLPILAPVVSDCSDLIRKYNQLVQSTYVMTPSDKTMSILVSLSIDCSDIVYKYNELLNCALIFSGPTDKTLSIVLTNQVIIV